MNNKECKHYKHEKVRLMRLIFIKL